MSILKCKVVPCLFWVCLVRRAPVFIIVSHASFALTTYIAAWDNTQSSNATCVYITARFYLDVRLTGSLWDVMLQRTGILPTVQGPACLDLPADIKWVSLRGRTPEQRCKSVNVKRCPWQRWFSSIAYPAVKSRRQTGFWNPFNITLVVFLDLENCDKYFLPTFSHCRWHTTVTSQTQVIKCSYFSL